LGNIKKILIIRFSSIGDIVLTTPLIRAIRNTYPGAVIDFVVKEQFVDLLRMNQYIDTILSYDPEAGIKGLWELIRIIRKEKYDLLLDIHKNPRSIFLRSLSKADRVLTYNKDTINRILLVWFKMNLLRDSQPVYLRYFQALNPLKIIPDDKGADLHVPDEVMKYVFHALRNAGIRSSQKIIVLCPGAGFSNKRWLPEGFAAVGNFCAQNHNAVVVLLGSAQDVEICEKVELLMKKRALNFSGKFSLLESAGVIRHSSLVVTNDTGLMHIAQSQRRPVLAIFGPTVREFGYFPFPDKSFVIEKKLPCRPCTKIGLNRCPKKHFRCMRDISVEEVVQAADQLLNSESFASRYHDE